MKLSICNIAWDPLFDNEMYRTLAALGFQGIEIAPTRVFQESPYLHLGEASVWADGIKHSYGLSVPSIQSIWYGRSESLFGTEMERQMLVDYSKKAIVFAGAVGAKNLVFGCPRNRNGYTGGKSGRNREIANSFFYELGEYAKAHGVAIGIEANPVIYNTDFLNTTEETLEFIKDVGSAGIKLNLDTGTLIYNEESIDLLIGSMDFISHVHISEPGLKIIKKRDLHRELFTLLQKENYEGFISIEIVKQEDISDIKKTMDYVKGVFG